MAAAVSSFAGPTLFMIVKQDTVNGSTLDRHQGWSLPEICYVPSGSFTSHKRDELIN